MEIFNFFKTKEWKLLWPTYSTSFFGSIIPQVSSIFVILWAARDFTFFQISLGFVVMRSAMFIFEIPTGVIADLYSKKISVLVHYLLSGVICIMLFFTHSFFLFLLLFFLEGVSKTLSTGAAESLEYERCQDDDCLIRKYYRNKEVIMKIAETIGDFFTVGLLFWLGGNAVYQIWNFKFFGMDILYLTTAFGYFVSFILYSFMKEKGNKKKPLIQNHFRESINQAKTTFSYIKNYKKMLWLFLFMIFVAEGVSFWEPVNQAFLMVYNFKPEFISAIIAIAGLFGSVLVILSKKLEKLLKNEHAYIYFVLIGDIILTLTVWLIISPFVAILFFILKSNIETILNPVIRPYFQKHIKTNLRATVLSVESFFGALLIVIVSPLEGYLLDIFGTNFVINAWLIFVFIAIYCLIMVKKNPSKTIENLSIN